MEDMRDGRRATGFLLLLLAIVILAACGGGGTKAAATPADDTTNPPADDPVTPPADDPADDPVEPPVDIVESTVASYSPFLVEDEEGQPRSLAWVYRVNGGQPLAVNAFDTVGTISFEAPLIVVYDPAAGQRNTMVPIVFEGRAGSATESMSGHGVVDVNEFVERVDGVTRILGRLSVLSMDAHSDALDYGLQSMATLDLEEPLSWFPDREDLGQVADGTVSGPGFDVLGVLSGIVTEMGSENPQDPIEFDETVSSRETWEVASHLETFEVLGRTYRDVVVVDLWTIVPDLREPGAAPEASTAEPVRMWFAKGVGLIKAEGMYRLWGQPVGVELIETNFTE